MNPVEKARNQNEQEPAKNLNSRFTPRQVRLAMCGLKLTARAILGEKVKTLSNGVQKL
jgi:hypothetical protein